jgi:hypothetical protein
MLCHACTKYHRRTIISWNYGFPPASYPDVNIEGLECDKWMAMFDHLEPRLSGGPLAQGIPWMTCHLVMRAERYSSKHGLPIHTLQYYSGAHRYRESFYEDWRSDHTPFIMGDSLLIRERSFLGADIIPPVKLSGAFEICHHISSNLFHQDFATALYEVNYKETGDCYYTGPVMGCKYCPTVFIVEAKPSWCYKCEAAEKAQRFRYTLSVTRYVNLGTCKSPLTREWHALKSKAPYKHNRFFSIRSMEGTELSFHHAVKDSRAPCNIFDERFLEMIESNHEIFSERLQEVKAEGIMSEVGKAECRTIEKAKGKKGKDKIVETEKGKAKRSKAEIVKVEEIKSEEVKGDVEQRPLGLSLAFLICGFGRCYRKAEAP